MKCCFSRVIIVPLYLVYYNKCIPSVIQVSFKSCLSSVINFPSSLVYYNKCCFSSFFFNFSSNLSYDGLVVYINRPVIVIKFVTVVSLQNISRQCVYAKYVTHLTGRGVFYFNWRAVTWIKTCYLPARAAVSRITLFN